MRIVNGSADVSVQAAQRLIQLVVSSYSVGSVARMLKAERLGDPDQVQNRGSHSQHSS